MDQSLDEIIREKRVSNPVNRSKGNRGGMRGRGGGGRGGGRGGGIAGSNLVRGTQTWQNPSQAASRPQNNRRGSWQQQQRQFTTKANFVDARQKLIQKAHQGDARDRLATKARQTDARVKLTSKRKSTEGPPGLQARVGGGAVGAERGGVPPPTAPLSRTVPNLGSTFTVRNPARVQNKTQITIRNSRQDPMSPPSLPMGTPSQRTSPRSSEALLAAASTLRVTKAVPQPQKRAAVDYPHFGDDLLRTRSQPTPPKMQRRMPERMMAQDRSWASEFSSRLHAPTPPQGTRLIISNLQISVTEDDIKELFGAIGELTKARMVRPGLAEVVYMSRPDALQAITTYHNRELDGKPMQCKLDTSTVPEAGGSRTTPNALSNRFKTMRAENNPKLPFEAIPKSVSPTGIDPGVVQKALFKKGPSSAAAQKPVVFTVKI